MRLWRVVLSATKMDEFSVKILAALEENEAFLALKFTRERSEL
jgi:hypothetical protein